MRLARLTIGAAAILLAAPLSASAAKPPLGDFVGKAQKTGFGVVLGADGTLAYACDGEVGTWFAGPRLKGKELVLRNGSKRLVLQNGSKRLRVTLDDAKLRTRAGDRNTTLRTAKGPAGLYRSENTYQAAARLQAPRNKLGGWVVQRSGKQVGVVAAGSAVSAAPKLSTTTLMAGSLVAAPVIDPSDALPLLLDLDDDGIDVSGTVTTSLLGGGSRTARWTRAGDDDAFVALDSGALKARGFKLSESGRVLARGGIKVTRNGVTTTAVDGFHLLRLLDGNGDGILSPADPAFEALLVFGDTNGDGNFGDTSGLNGGDMVATMAAMNMQFLALQGAVQAESRKFTTLSNASRASHDIALNAIRTIK